MNAARCFQRRENYQLPQTPRESPFRKFTVRCLVCGSYQLRLVAKFDEAAAKWQWLWFAQNARSARRFR